MDLTPESLRARFAELQGQRVAILGQSFPLRDQRDAISAAAQDQIAALDDQIKAIEAGMSDIDGELALISRALGGKTGE